MLFESSTENLKMGLTSNVENITALLVSSFIFLVLPRGRFTDFVIKKIRL